MILLIVFLLCLLVSLWLLLFYLLTDFLAPLRSITGFKKILVIFPHPDDEVLTTAGLLRKAHEQGIQTSLLVLTKGERGNEGAHLDNSLKKIRERELQRVAQVTDIDSLYHLDLGDGQLMKKRSQVELNIDKVLQTEKPNLVITYDLTGLYGHPDHILASEVVTNLIQKKYRQTKLWYVSYPKKALSFMKLPEHMAQDPEFKAKRVFPTHKVWVGWQILSKIKAFYAYESQFFAFRKSFPKPLPMWYYISTGVFEHFHEVKK